MACRMKATPLLPALVLLLGNELQARSLLTNGGFEAPIQSGGAVTGLSVGSSGLPGWSIGGTGSIFLVTAPLQSLTNAAEGTQYISFNGNNVRLSQSFNTVPGASYEVSFSAGYY